MSDGNDTVEEVKPVAKKAATKKAVAKKVETVKVAAKAKEKALNAILDEIIQDILSRKQIPEKEINDAKAMRVHNLEESERQLAAIEAHIKKYEGWAETLESCKV